MNDQKPEPAVYDRLGVLDVHSIFATIQGEGPFCGERALFIRLAGCNLMCPGCDTEYTAGRTTRTTRDIIADILERQWPQDALIVITGGEPMRQNISPLVCQLLTIGYRVQLETNGVVEAPQLPWNAKGFSVVVSPKTSHISGLVFDNALAFKYVVRMGDIDIDDGLPTRALLHKASPRVARPRKGARVYVQPMDEGDDTLNQCNLDIAISIAMQHGHTLQLQTHKILDLP